MMNKKNIQTNKTHSESSHNWCVSLCFEDTEQLLSTDTLTDRFAYICVKLSSWRE